AGCVPCYGLSEGVIVAQEPQERRAGAAARGLHATYVDRVIAPLRQADQSAVEPAQGVFEDRRTRDLGAPRRPGKRRARLPEFPRRQLGEAFLAGPQQIDAEAALLLDRSVAHGGPGDADQDQGRLERERAERADRDAADAGFALCGDDRDAAGPAPEAVPELVRRYGHRLLALFRPRPTASGAA